ncbi:MAG TPA: phage tail assembly protein [Rhizomicrobium sp.]|nr:phage tail assembly protein [Rhizomicrobium sp.]
MDTITLVLAEPIAAHGKDLTTLTFKKPNGATIRRCGAPTKIQRSDNGDAVMLLDMDSYARYVSECAQIPLPSVDTLSAEDFFACVGVIDGFFGQSKTQERAGTETSS